MQVQILYLPFEMEAGVADELVAGDCPPGCSGLARPYPFEGRSKRDRRQECFAITDYPQVCVLWMLARVVCAAIILLISST